MPTLSATLILQKTLEAYRTLFPMLGAMGTDYSDAPLRLNDQVIAHIRTLPTSAAYDASTGYANGATEGRSLLVDIPITVDRHRHVPLKFEHLNLIKDQKDVYQNAIADAAWVLGREMIQSILAKAKSSAFSAQTVETVANTDLDTLEAINTAMNIAGASPSGRIGIVNSSVAGALAMDSRIASKDYYGMLTGGQAYRVFRAVAGFQAIYEFPSLSLNNAASQTFTAATTDICTAVAHGFQTGDRVRVSNAGGGLPTGLAAATTYFVIRLSADTFSLAATAALAAAGTAIDITGAGTGTQSIVGYENLTGLFFEKSAIAVRAGIPSQTAELAAALGIPQLMPMDVLKDPDNGNFQLALMKWQQTGTGHLYVSPTSIWGSALGRQGGAAGALTDIGGHRLVSD